VSIGRHRRRPSLLVVGAASRDIDPGDPRGWRLGGGVTYGALVAARLGLEVRALIGADDDASAADELGLLRSAGVELVLVKLRRGPLMHNRELPGGRVQSVGQASERMPVEALPRTWRHAPGILLAPIADELPAAWATAFDKQAFVALAWQGLVRRLVAGRPMIRLPLQRRALIARADIGLVSTGDVVAGGVPLRRLLGRDGQQLVVTHGERGALHLERARGRLRGRFVPAIAAAETADSTGAGDVFLAAWCAAILSAPGSGQGDQRWRPLAVAASAASLSVEGIGVAGVPDLSALCTRLLRLPGAPSPLDA
jgi:sugar/nucleoside kinase (ribokinase family)